MKNYFFNTPGGFMVSVSIGLLLSALVMAAIRWIFNAGINAAPETIFFLGLVLMLVGGFMTLPELFNDSKDKP